jgi:outer membrane autotransporter protein
MRATFNAMEVSLVKQLFIRSRLTCAVALAVCCNVPTVLAANLNGQRATVNAGDAPDTWQLINGSTLNVTPLGTTDTIRASSGSTVNLIGSSTFSSTGPGVQLNQSTATISGANITSTGDFGLSLITDLAGTPGTKATVTDSTISGSGRGISNAFGEINLSNTIVNGTDAGGTGFLNGGVGIALFAGQASLTNNSRVTGDMNGILISPDSAGGSNVSSTLTVDNSTVTGTNGSAIIVGSYDDARPGNATITIQNGSTLSGGNGIILEVANNSTAGITVDNSRLTGDVLVNAGSAADVTLQNNAALNGNVNNVANFTLNNGSSLSGNLTDTTNLNAHNNSSVTGNIADVENFNLTGNSSVSGNLSNVENLSLDNSVWTTGDGNGVTNLSMNAGTVKLGATEGTFETLTVATLSGNGRFVMDTDLAAHLSDLVNVTGHATGNYDLQIKNTGAEPLKGDQDQQVVHTGAGSDAAFGVVGGQVDLGTFAYGLEQRGTDWFLVQKLDDNGDPIVTPGTQSVIDLFSAAPTVWYGELSTLRSRMGELRYGQSAGGGWMRAYGNKYNTSAGGGSDYSQNQQGISFGADGALPTSDGQWLLGVMAGYSKSDLDIASGTNGTVKSSYIGVYSTWLSSEGYYIDAIIKANHFKNRSDVRMSDGTLSNGDYNNNGIGGSIEAGKHIKLADNWFVEPFTQFSALWVDGQNYSLNNGMDASSNKADSFLGKVGTSVGRNFPLEKGGFVQPYMKVALAHEFANNNKVQVNTTTFRNNLSGSRGEIGAGIAAQLTDKWQVHGDVDYSNGEHIEQPWGVNLGLRYSW